MIPTCGEWSYMSERGDILLVLDLHDARQALAALVLETCITWHVMKDTCAVKPLKSGHLCYLEKVSDLTMFLT